MLELMRKTTAAVLIMCIFFSCKKEDYSYRGPAFVDFQYPVQYVTIAGNVTANYTVPVKIRLGGPQSGSPYNVTVAVDPSSTAVSGTHYSIENTTVQIPANSSFGEIPVTFLIPSFPEQTSVKLVLVITGGNLKINENYKYTVLYVYRQGFIDIFTGNYTCEEPDVPVSVTYDVTLTADTVKNRIRISNFWGFAAENSKVYIDLISTSDSVLLPSQPFTDKLNRTYTVSGKGTYNISNGSIRLSYFLSQNGSTYTDSGQQIYTRK